MTKRKIVGLTVAAALLVAAGGLMVSNMGFKLNYTLDNQPASRFGDNTISLPYNRQTGINTARDLQVDIGSASVVNIQKYLKSSATYQVYTGRRGSGPDYNLVAGEGYFVRMNTTTNYIVVGSHDPSLAITLDNQPTSRFGDNFFAYPYHHTAGTARALQVDIGSASVVNVQKYLRASATYQVYTGRRGSGPDYNLAPGEAYFIRMNTTTNYTPSHY